jgi:hypothetical protein
MIGGQYAPRFCQRQSGNCAVTAATGKEAIKDQEPYVAQRFHAMALSIIKFPFLCRRNALVQWGVLGILRAEGTAL